MSVYQKIFDNETIQDYDLIEMLKSASEKVKTQKLLLVAHSQGNFYANSFYDTVAEKQGGVPRELNRRLQRCHSSQSVLREEESG